MAAKVGFFIYIYICMYKQAHPVLPSVLRKVRLQCGAVGDHGTLVGDPLPEPPASHPAAPDILCIPGPGLSWSNRVF